MAPSPRHRSGLPSAFSEALAAGLGSEPTAASALGGGDNARSWRVELDDGRTVFAKTQPGAPPGALTTEALGLTWLAEGLAAGAAATGQVPELGVPAVLAVSDGVDVVGAPNFLALEWIDEGGRADGRVDAALGRSLAALHAGDAETFGRVDRRRTGSRGLPNEPCDDWGEFYATQRLLPLARLAADTGALPPATVAALEAVAGRLDVVGGPPEPPARLHGDLWAGNRIVDRQGRNWLVDPAAHGGHREFDLAMTDLFGGYGPEFRAAYDEAAPLADGWRERVALHQIAPLVTHAIKFGGGYRAAATRAIEQYR